MSWDYLTPEEQQKAACVVGAVGRDVSYSKPLPAPRHRGAIALFDYATADHRHRDLADWIGDARATVDEGGRREETPERSPRRSIERIDKSFRASAGGGLSALPRFRADFATFGEAWEGVRVLAGLWNSLHYALGDPADPRARNLEPELDRDIDEAYLKRLARETVARSGSTARPGTVTVRRESLMLECDCTTPERANLFLAVFDMLADDLLDILDWKPLREAD